MAAVEELIRSEADGSLSFGNHQLSEKAKKEEGVYKVKTYGTMTKLEKDGLFVYESVPGTSVTGFKRADDGVSFCVSGNEDAQLTLGLLEDTEYSVFVDGSEMGKMKTKLGGKLTIGVELSPEKEVKVEVRG